MLPFRHSTLFRSRWAALLWSAGIVWTAIQIAGKPEGEPANNTASNASAPADQDGPLNAKEFDETAKLVRQLDSK